MSANQAKCSKQAGHGDADKAVETEVDQNKHVLMITYVFPPSAWVGVHRTLKYCRYLGDHGWTPVVLTARTEGVTFIDEDLLRQVPSHIDVYRTLDIDPAKWEEKLTERKLRRIRGKDDAHASPRSSGIASSPDTAPASALLQRLMDWVKTVLKDSPDSHVFWVPFAFCRGVWILFTQRIDVIYCSTPPHSSHIVAYLLAKTFRKPYVLDFRDPWYVTGSIRTPTGKLKGLLKLETLTKRAIVRQAAHVICVSRGERDELRAEFPELEANRFSFISNGFDPADMIDEGTPVRSSNKLLMTHAGTIYPGAGGAFFTALEQLYICDVELREKLEVRLLGEIAAEYQDVLQRLEGFGIVNSHGLVPHAKSLRMIRESDVLLILMGGTNFLPSHIPAKTFEYLQAEKPILAITADGELADIARQSGLGIVVPPESTELIGVQLRELLAAGRARAISRQPARAFISSFERPALTRRLAGVLDAVVGRSNDKSGVA